MLQNLKENKLVEVEILETDKNVHYNRIGEC